MKINKSSKYINLSNPLISIITPTMNRPEWLRITLNSLLKQSYSNLEILLINDAGVDVQNIVDEFNDTRIRYYQNPINLDLAGTRNVAIEKSQGDYFVMCDDDDILYDHALEFRLSLINKYRSEVVYTHALKTYYEKKENSYRAVGTSLYWHSENIKDLLLIQNLAPCNCYMWSRKAQEKAGLFDISLNCSEDWAHTVEMRQYFDFKGSDIIDCNCSFRLDNSQMSGSRTGFTTHLPYLYKKWRKYAIDLEFVKFHQNESLKARGLSPSDFDL